jgi:hypothetical protein
VDSYNSYTEVQLPARFWKLDAFIHRRNCHGEEPEDMITLDTLQDSYIAGFIHRRNHHNQESENVLLIFLSSENSGFS